MAIALPDLIVQTRQFLKDFPKLNELRGLQESTDMDLALYASMALDDYNLTPPIIYPVTFENFPSNSLLILGTICYTLLSNGILQFRNSISYQDGGNAVNVWDKGPAYIGNAQFFSQLWESKKNALKRAINIANGGWGVIQSAEFNLYSYMRMYGGDFIISTVGTNLSPSSATISFPGNSPIQSSDNNPAKIKTKSILFSINDFALDANPDYYSLHFYHNLLCREVNVILEDPNTLEDLSSKIKVFRVTDNNILLKVTRNPDGRLNGLVQCSIP